MVGEAEARREETLGVAIRLIMTRLAMLEA